MSFTFQFGPKYRLKDMRNFVNDMGRTEVSKRDADILEVFGMALLSCRASINSDRILAIVQSLE